MCAHIDLLNYDLTYVASAPTDCQRIPTGCVTSTYPFGQGDDSDVGDGDIALPLNYRDHCSTFHAFQAFLILAALLCTALPVFMALQLLVHKLGFATRLIERYDAPALYRIGVGLPATVLVLAILSLVCMPTTVDDDWAAICAELLTYSGSAGGGFDLCQTPPADWGPSFDCHVCGVVLLAIAMVCYVVAWVQETK